MNPWSALTEQDVLNQFNDSEMAAYDAAKGDTASASLPDIINKVIDQIVDAYATAGRLIDNSVGTAPANGTIPAGDKLRAVAIARWKYLLALPTGKALAENRKDEAKAAEDYFIMVAQRKIKAAAAVAFRGGRRIRTGSFDKLGET